MLQCLVGRLACGEMAALRELAVVVKSKVVTEEMEVMLRVGGGGVRYGAV